MLPWVDHPILSSNILGNLNVGTNDVGRAGTKQNPCFVPKEP